jgi:PTS system nitrogen regulatory IIA component
LVENGRIADPPEVCPVKRFADLVSPADIRLDMAAASKSQLLEEIGSHMERQHGLPRNWVVQALARREQVGSTGVGEGVAIPHARVRGLDYIQTAYLRLRAPIPFGAADGRPVSHVVVLLVPKEAAEEHLEVLAAATTLFADSRFREQLDRCGDPGEVMALLAAWPPTGPRQGG